MNRRSPTAGAGGFKPARVKSRILLLLALVAACQLQPACAAAGQAPPHANFGLEQPSGAAVQMVDWVLHARDNKGLPFIIVDKIEARVFVFDANGSLKGATAALMGLARGDDSVPGIGERPLATIRPEERTTPAGRFVASLDRNLHGVGILWVDYDLALSLHRVVAGSAREQRAQRLLSPSALDNRITYGCINVPVDFYNKVVMPAFTGTNGIVYILPETRSLSASFTSYHPVPAIARPGLDQ
ncbi:MAG: hypothetical protein JWP36_401 [Paucimonas sp.]|nr:hypothetical protein [Paucimonas sp.]